MSNRTDVLGNPVLTSSERESARIKKDKLVRKMIIDDMVEEMKFGRIDGVNDGLRYLSEREGIDGDPAMDLWKRAIRKWRDWNDRRMAPGKLDESLMEDFEDLKRKWALERESEKFLRGEDPPEVPSQKYLDIQASDVNSGRRSVDDVLDRLLDAGYEDGDINYFMSQVEYEKRAHFSE